MPPDLEFPRHLAVFSAGYRWPGRPAAGTGMIAGAASACPAASLTRDTQTRGDPMPPSASMGGSSMAALRAMHRDDSVKNHTLAPGIAKRILAFARPYRR